MTASNHVTAGWTLFWVLPGLLVAQVQRPSAPPSLANLSAPVVRAEVVGSFPHDPTAHTQGLVFANGFLYESTGLKGKSTLVKTQLDSGKVLERIVLDPEFQTEGLSAYQNRLYQLTLDKAFGFVYERDPLVHSGRFAYPGAGAAWGIENDGNRFYIVGPTATLRRFDAATLQELDSVVVRDAEQPIHFLDELEFVKGELWANVYKTNKIAVIAVDSGRVVRWIDLAAIAGSDGRLLSRPSSTANEVLNGIAYDRSGNRLFVTGKYWPTVFEIRIP